MTTDDDDAYLDELLRQLDDDAYLDELLRQLDDSETHDVTAVNETSQESDSRSLDAEIVELLVGSNDVLDEDPQRQVETMPSLYSIVAHLMGIPIRGTDKELLQCIYEVLVFKNLLNPVSVMQCVMATLQALVAKHQCEGPHGDLYQKQLHVIEALFASVRAKRATYNTVNLSWLDDVKNKRKYNDLRESGNDSEPPPKRQPSQHCIRCGYMYTTLSL